MKRSLDAQVALIHGSGLETGADGKIYPSAETKGNLAVGLDLLQNGRVERLLVSGAGPLHDVDYGHDTEAELGVDWLISRGARADRLLKEDTSSSTLGNWANSAPIIEAAGLESVIGIARDAQIFRARRIGEFVANQSAFEIAGYLPGEETARSLRGRAIDYGRETASLALFELFKQMHPNAPRQIMEALYTQMKDPIGFTAVKRHIGR